MTKTTTGERMTKLETRQEYTIAEIHELKELIIKHIANEDERHEQLKNKFASKWVEKWFVKVISVVCLAFLTALISVVLI